MFAWEFSVIFKNIYFIEHLRAGSSENLEFVPKIFLLATLTIDALNKFLVSFSEKKNKQTEWAYFTWFSLFIFHICIE